MLRKALTIFAGWIRKIPGGQRFIDGVKALIGTAKSLVDDILVNIRKEIMSPLLKIWDWIKGQWQKDWLMFLLAASLLGLILAGAFTFVWWVIIASAGSESGSHNVLTVLGSAAAGVVLTINAIYIGKRATAQNKTADAQDRTAKAQVVANEQNLFNQAIGHLGNKDESVRLGGIHALYKLAEDEPTREEYVKTVANILCAHVRSKTNSESYKGYQRKPSIEIQSLLDLLAKGNGSEIFKNQRFDFSGAYLQGANFWGARFQGVNFWEAHLQGASFWEAKIQGANFEEAKLQGAHFWKAQLQGANFWNAKLQGAYFKEAKLQGVNFWNAQLQGVNFWNAQLQGASFKDAELQRAFLKGAQFQGAYSTNIDIPSFGEIINVRAGESADMEKAIVEGGLTEDKINLMEESLNPTASYWIPGSEEYAEYLLKDLRNDHTGDPVYGSNQWFDNKGAITYAYGPEEAKAMIDEYRKATE